MHPKFQVLRGLLLLGSSLFAFASLRYMPVGEFTAIVSISPLAVTLLAATVLKEHVSPMRWVLVAGGFLGSVIIIRPGGAAFTWASLLPLGLVITNAWFQVLTSKLARTEDPVTMHLWTGWVGTIVASFALPFVWTSIPNPWLWLLLCFMGVAATIGHFLLILAFQRAPAATLTPYLYSQIAFAMILGLVVFSHVPDNWALAGMVLIAVCGAGGGWLTVRESRVKMEPVEA
jgi:drug/metabolite transporter (DMT)-like permease